MDLEKAIPEFVYREILDLKEGEDCYPCYTAILNNCARWNDGKPVTVAVYRYAGKMLVTPQPPVTEPVE